MKTVIEMARAIVVLMLPYFGVNDRYELVE
jgi:hypothetical protein